MKDRNFRSTGYQPTCSRPSHPPAKSGTGETRTVKKVILCRCGRNCPSALIGQNAVTIEDDFGNKVVLDKEQVEMLYEEIKKDDKPASAT